MTDRKKGINYRGYAMVNAFFRDTSTHLSMGERMVALTILGSMTDETKGRMSDGTPAIWMSAPMLARRCGLSPKSERLVRKHVKKLTDLGIIRTETRKGGATNLATLFAPGDIKWAPRRKDGSFDFEGLLRLFESEPSGPTEPEGKPSGLKEQTIRSQRAGPSGFREPVHPVSESRPENSKENSTEKSNREEENNPDLDWGEDTEGDEEKTEVREKRQAAFPSGGNVYQFSKEDVLADIPGPTRHPGDY